MRRFLFFFFTFLLLAGAWSAGWWILQRKAQTYIAQMFDFIARPGLGSLHHQPVEPGGWPWGVSLAYPDFVLERDAGWRVDLGTPVVNWQVSDPWWIGIDFTESLEAVRPGAVRGEHLPLTVEPALSFLAQFSSLRVGLGLGRTEVEAVQIAGQEINAVATTALDNSAARASLQAASLFLEAKSKTPGSLEEVDWTGRLTTAQASLDGAQLFPEPINLSLSGRVNSQSYLLYLLREGPQEERKTPHKYIGLPNPSVDFHHLVFSVGETKVTLRGILALNDYGFFTGSLYIAAENLEWLSEQVRAGKPISPPLALLASTLLIAGKPEADKPKTRSLVLDFKEGAITANGFPISENPSLFSALR